MAFILMDNEFLFKKRNLDKNSHFGFFKSLLNF